jgi:copper chaperone CopZ
MTKSAVLKVLSMHCALNVQEALDGLDGVERAEGEVSAEQFREAIEDAGYALVGAEKG